MIGKIAVFIHSTSIRVPGGRSGRMRWVSAWVRCRAVCMSVPHANCAEISLEPREVVDRTRRTPGTR